MEIHRVSKETLRVVEVDAHTDPRWKAFVEAQAEGLIFHHPSWLNILEAEYGHPAECLACEDSDGKLQGVLPLQRTRGLPFNVGGGNAGRRLSSLPRTPLAGPLAVSDESAAALVSGAIARVRSNDGVRLQIKVPSPRLDGLVDGLVCVPWRETYVLDLPHSQEEALRFGNARNHSTIKRAVSRATKSGVRVRRAETVADLRAWYTLYLETMRWNSVPPRPYRFFRAMWDELVEQDLMCLLLAERDGPRQTTLLGGLLLVMFGQTVTYLFGARRGDSLDLRPNEALHWRAIHDARALGFRYYDFGEVPREHQGLAQFKKKWGTRPVQLYRCYYPGIAIGTGPSIRGPGAPLRHLAKAAWRRVPLKATAMIGDRLYAYL